MVCIVEECSPDVRDHLRLQYLALPNFRPNMQIWAMNNEYCVLNKIYSELRYRYNQWRI